MTPCGRSCHSLCICAVNSPVSRDGWSFPVRPRHDLLAIDLVTWQAMVGRHILEDIVGRVAHTETESFITEDDTSQSVTLKLPEVGKNPVDTAYDVGSKRLSGRRLLKPASVSRLLMVSLDGTGCLEGGPNPKYSMDVFSGKELGHSPETDSVSNGSSALLLFYDGITVCIIKSTTICECAFGLANHQNNHQARRRFVEWAQNQIAFVPNFNKRILFSDEAPFWLTGYVNKQNCRIWSEANPQVYVETPLHPEKLTVWGALWAGGILLQKR
ncbi:transposase [Trichonephila clavipes]|nr:transposase [Trichonephila clavipes]